MKRVASRSCGSTPEGHRHRRRRANRYGGPMRACLRMFPPERIVCLTEETVETLYLLGEDRRLSAFRAMRCAHRRCGARNRASRLLFRPMSRRSSDFKPDLVLTFSDLQADIVAELIRRNVAVHAFNQRDIAGISRHDPHARRLVGATRRSRRAGGSLGAGSIWCASGRRPCPAARASISRSGTTR